MVNGDIVLVTGAGSGIGLEISKAFAEAGAKVIITDVNAEAAHTAAQTLQEAGHDVIGLTLNVTDEAQVQSVFAETMKQYGRIDVLINNAGLQHVSPIEDFPTEKFEFMIKIMLTAPFMAIKHVFPIMKEQGYGRIINMASINGLIGFAGKAAYNSAKHGLLGLTKVAALEGAEHGITVNALCPGYVDTPLVRNQMADLAKTRQVELEKVLEDVIYPLVPQKRLLAVEEIADYALFLASRKAKGITGQANVLDGGYTIQ